MRRLAATMTSLLLLCAATCHRPKEERVQLDQLTITTAEITDGDLVIRYRFHNRAAEPVFLENRLFERTEQGRKVDSNLAYTQMDGRTLILRKGRAPIPDDMDVEVPEVPYLTRVEPDASFEEEFRLALPVEPRDPYRQPPAGHSTATQLVLIVGVVAGVEVQRVETAGEPELWAYPADVERVDTEVRTAPIELEIPTAFALDAHGKP